MATQKRSIFLILSFLVLVSLSCQAVMRGTGQSTVQGTPRPSVETLLSAEPTQALPSATPVPTALPSFTPTRTATPTPAPSPTPDWTATPRPTASDQQLQVFQELWETVRDEYLYADFNGLDWEAIGAEYRSQVEAGLSDEEFYLLMDEMIASLGDEHSVYFSPEQALEEDAEFEGEYNYVGIGVLTSVVLERQRVTVILVFPGGPAEEAGIQVHDSILEVDGQPILDDEGFRRNLLRGPENSTVTLTLQTPGEEPRQVTLTRQRISSSMPVPYEVLSTPGGKRIGYILLPTFNDSTIDGQVREALQTMTSDEPLDGLIVDNRLNGGGVSHVFNGVLGFFTKGTVGYFVNREEKQAVNIVGENLNGSFDLPLVVLVGPDTASFGEIFAGVLKDIGRAHLIGQPTNGNVEVLYIYEFIDGSRAWLAHDTFQPVNNAEENWEETGIIPDQTIFSNWDEVTSDTDPVVLTALDYFDQE